MSAAPECPACRAAAPHAHEADGRLYPSREYMLLHCEFCGAYYALTAPFKLGTHLRRVLPPGLAEFRRV